MKKMVCELCGSNDFTKDSDGLFVCDYCRTKYTPAQAQNLLVEGTVRVDRSEDVGKFLTIAQAALSHDNAAEAYDYANRALEIDPSSSEAWLVKGKAAGWSSSLFQPRHKEMIGAFSMAIEHAPEDQRDDIKIDAAAELNEVAVTVHRLSRTQAHQNPDVEEYWNQHIDRTDEAITLFFKSHEWSGNRQPLDNVISVANDLFHGPSYELPDNNPSTTLTGMLISSATANSRRVTRSLNPSGQEYFRGKIAEATDRIRVIDPDFQAPVFVQQEKKALPCFVVTATMGNTQSLPVRVLQRFRDDVLTRTRIGSRFINWYYDVGPRLAEKIGESLTLRALAFVTVVAPATLYALIGLGVNRIMPRR